MKEGVRYLKWTFWHCTIIILMAAAFGHDSRGALHVLYVLVPFFTLVSYLLAAISDRTPLMPFDITACMWLGYSGVFAWNNEYALAIATTVRVYMEAVRIARLEKFHGSSVAARRRNSAQLSPQPYPTATKAGTPTTHRRAGMSTDTPAATTEREAFEQWCDSRLGKRLRSVDGDFDYPLGRILWEAWQGRAALSAPVAAQPAASGVDAKWVETANDLADKAIAAEREFTEAEVEALCSTIRSDLNLKAGRARDSLRTHLSTALTGAAKECEMSGNYCDVCHRFVPIDAEHQCEGPRASIAGAQPAPAAPSGTQAVIAPPSDRDPHFGGNSYDASLLRELLAVIHRDGGHYIAQHGIEKACADAAAQWLAAPAAQPADSVMEVLTDLLQLHEHCPNIKTCDLADYNEWFRADTAAWDRARALVAKETSHG